MQTNIKINIKYEDTEIMIRSTDPSFLQNIFFQMQLLISPKIVNRLVTFQLLVYKFKINKIIIDDDDDEDDDDGNTKIIC